jgi:hypothetical protein
MADGLKHDNGTFGDLAAGVPRHHVVRHRGIITTAADLAKWFP